MAVLLTQLFAQLKYDVGDQISDERLKMEFEYCYPGDSTNSTFSFNKHAEKIFVLDMSATW